MDLNEIDELPSVIRTGLRGHMVAHEHIHSALNKMKTILQELQDTINGISSRMDDLENQIEENTAEI